MYDQLQVENGQKKKITYQMFKKKMVQLELAFDEVDHYNENVMNAEKYYEARQQGEALSSPKPLATGNLVARGSESSEPCSEEACGAKKVSKKLIL